MAKSLDQLVDFLIEEIAIGGEQGQFRTHDFGVLFVQKLGAVGSIVELAIHLHRTHRGTSVQVTVLTSILLFHHRQHQELSGTDSLNVGLDIFSIVQSVKEFYAQPRPSPLASTQPTTGSFKVDHKFIAKVWRWLTRHDDVLVNGEHISNWTDGSDTVSTSLISEASSLSSFINTTDSDNVPESLAQQEALIASNNSRLTVTAERVYFSLCGHAYDPSRLPPLEYALIRAIAPTRQAGILQGQLVQLTGQDKRSVPQRTDRLHQKGYIVKRTAFLANGQKTSRLILRRFADVQSDINKTQNREQISEAGQVSDEDRDDLAPLVDSTALPQWNPDRLLPNQLYDLATEAGSSGLTNSSARRCITGLTVRRPVEAILTRVSHNSLESQPTYARHFVLVRTTETENGNAQYIHRTLDTYNQMVQDGQASWSSITGGEDDVLLSEAVEKGLEDDTSIRHDLELRAKPSGLFDDVMDLETAIRTIAAPRVPLRNDEPVLIEEGPRNSVQLSTFSPLQAAASNARLTSLSAKKRNSKTKSSKNSGAIGRPRKFARGLEKFWRDMFLAYKQTEDAESLKQSGKSGLTQDPDLLAWYKNRPAQFDETVLEAMEKHLPIPAEPDDVCKEWVDQMRKYLDRTVPGSYYTPPGSGGTVLRAKGSQVVTIRSPRLKELDLFLTERPATVHFLASSVSHTLRRYQHHQEGTPWVNAWKDIHDPDFQSRVRDVVPNSPVIFPAKPVNFAFQERVFPAKTGPQRGIFRDDTEPSSIHSRPRRTTKRKRGDDTDGENHDSGDLDKTASESEGALRHQTNSDHPKGKKQRIQKSHASNSSSTQAKGIRPPSNHSPPAVVGSISKTFSRSIRSSSEISEALSAGQEFSPSLLRWANVSSKDVDEGLVDFDNHIDLLMPINPFRGNARGGTVLAEAKSTRSKRRRFAKPALEVDENLLSRVNAIQEAALKTAVQPRSRTKEVYGAKTSLMGKAANVSSPFNNRMAHDTYPAATGFDLRKPPPEVLSETIPVSQANLVNSRATEPSTQSRLATPSASSEPDETPETPDRSVASGRESRKERGMNKPSAKPVFIKGAAATSHYRQFVLDLLALCNGVVPDSPPLLKRCMRVKCIEANIESNINVKLLKSQLTQMAARGKIRLTKFAYQKDGANYFKGIITMPDVKDTDEQYVDLRQKIIGMPPEEDYMPPDLEAEARRRPSSTLSRDETRDNEPWDRRRQAWRDDEGTNEEEILSRRPKRRKLSSTTTDGLSPNTGFLTLKVPRISSITTSSTFTSHYFDLPPQPAAIYFNPDANTAATRTASPTPSSQRRSGVRIPRRSSYKPGTRSIEWRVPRSTALPKSIRAILIQDKTRKEARTEPGANRALAAFEYDVDLVATWEQSTFDDLQEPKAGEWNFINHLMPEKEFTLVKREQDLVWRLVCFLTSTQDADTLEELSEDLPEVESWPVFAAIATNARLKQDRIDKAAAKRKRKSTMLDWRDDGDDADEDELSDSEGPIPRVKRTRTRVVKEPKKRKAGTTNDKRTHKRQKLAPRGVGMRHLAKDDAHRVTLAFVVAIVLMGGLDRHVNFGLVQRLLPSETPNLLRSRWKVLSNRYVSDMSAYIQDFQMKYLEALNDSKVPTVEYSDVDKTDFEGILQWAVDNVTTQSTSLPFELPPSRQDFLQLNEVLVPEPRPIRNLYNQSLNFTVLAREEAWCSVVTGTTSTSRTTPAGKDLGPSYPAEVDEQDLAIARTRSWVLAAALTPSTTFDPTATRTKLLRLGKTEPEVEALLQTTTKQLQADKILVRQDNGDAVTLPDGSAYSGTHGWKISWKFFDKFEANRNIAASMLRGAAKYKHEVLDPAFLRGETIGLPKNPDISDGAMMAILNLMDMGMLNILPGKDVPASRYGLDWEDKGYQTRTMDRDVLSFSIVLQPTSTYVHGDFAAEARATVYIPRGGIDDEDGLGMIPIWFDINQTFHAHIWEMVVGAVVGIISSRPGISTTEIVRTLSWAMSKHDVHLVTKYLNDCRMTERTGDGWETTEWWWLATGAGAGNEHAIEWLT